MHYAKRGVNVQLIDTSLYWAEAHTQTRLKNGIHITHFYPGETR